MKRHPSRPSLPAAPGVPAGAFADCINGTCDGCSRVKEIVEAKALRTQPASPAPVAIWDVERKVFHVGPMAPIACCCGEGPCKGCAYGNAKERGPEWWLT